jgi:hypothetical protein
MRQRRWIGADHAESIDLRQQRLLDLVLKQVRHYYAELYQTRACYKYPLSVTRLMKLCNRSGSRILMAVRILSHSFDIESETEPPLYYERASGIKNPMHRPYRIFLRSRHG